MDNPYGSPLRLRNLPTYTAEQEFQDDNANASVLRRSFLNTLTTEDAGRRRQDELEAQVAGDERAAAEAAYLRNVARGRQLAIEGPTTLREVYENDGAGAGTYLQNVVGSVAGSMLPSLAASAAGTAVAGPVGGIVGAGLASYSSIRPAELEQYAADPEISELPPERQLEMSRNSAALQALPEALLPAYLTAGGRLPAAMLRMSAPVRLGAASIGEGVTEGVQDQISQRVVQNEFPDRQIDWEQTGEAVAAGVIGGGVTTAALGGGPGEAPQPRTDGIPLNGAPPPVATPPTGPVPLNPGTPPPVAPPADPAPAPTPNQPVPGGPPVPLNPKSKTPVTDQLEARAAELGPNATPEQLLETPDMRDVALLGPETADPWVLRAPDAATAVRDREETLTNRAFAALGDVLATPGVPEAVRTQMLQMVDPTTQAVRPEMRQQAIQLATDLRTKNKTASVIDQLAGRDEGVVQKNNLMSLPTTELKPLIVQLAKRLPDDRRNEAPTLARQLVAGVTRKLSNKTLSSLQQLDAELIDTLTAVAGSPDLSSAVEKIRNQNSALNDLRRSRTEKGASFFESMLAPSLPPQYAERAARVVDEIADSGLDNMTERRRLNVLKALAPVFGSDQNTRAVIEYYGNVRREDKAALTDDTDAVADDGDDTNTTGYAPGVGFVDTEPDGLDDGEVDIGAPMSEVDPSKPRYAFRDAKAARPFDVDVIPNFQRSKVTYTPEENAPYESEAADILAAVDRAVSRVQTDPELRKRPAVRDATSARLERTRAIVSRWYDKYGARAVVELLDTSKNRRRHAGAFEALNRIKSGTPDKSDAEFITLTQYLDETAGGVAAAEKRKLAREQGKEAGLNEAQINRMLAEVDNDDFYAVELNRRRRDIEDRLEDARRNNKTAQVERLENMLAMVELTAAVQGQEAALDLFEVISVRNRDQNDMIATDEQIREFGALLKAKDPEAQKTKINFIDPDGREVSLSAESIYKTIGEERGVTSATTSQDRAKQLFADGVASLLARGYKLAPGTNLSKVLVDRQMNVYAEKRRSPERNAAFREERDRFNQSVAKLREQLQTADTVGAKLYRAVARSAQRGGKTMSTRRRDQLHAQLIARRDQLRAPITKYETELAAWEAKLAAAKAAGEDFRVTDAMQSRKPVPPPKAVYDRLVRPNDIITLAELDMFEAIQKDFDAALDAKHEPKSAFVKDIVAPARQIVARRSAELSSMREQTRRSWEEYFNTKDTDAYNAAREAQARVDLADDQLRGMRDALTKMGDAQWIEQWELDDSNPSGVIEQDEGADIKAIRNRDTNIEDFVDEYSMTIATRAKDFVPLREDFETMDAAQVDKVLEFMSIGEVARALSQAQKDLAAIPEGGVVSARQRERIAMLQGALKRRYQAKAVERKRVRRWETLSRRSDESGTQMELPLSGNPKASTAKVTPPQGVDASVNAVANPDQGDLFETPPPSLAQQLQSRGWVRKAQTSAAQQERAAPEEGLPKKRTPLQLAALDAEMAAADVNASQAAVGGRIRKEGGNTVRIAKQEALAAKLRLQGMLGRPPAATERMSSVFARAEKTIERLLTSGQTEKAEQLRAQLEAAKASVRKADAARAAQAERDRQDRASEPTELDKAIDARRAADAERRAKPKVAPAPVPTKPSPEFDKLPSYTPGQDTRVYTGVGSRETPAEIQQLMTQYAKRLEALGYTLRTGDATGADSAFAAGATNKQVFKAKDATDQTRAIAREIHPAPENLKSEYVVNLMARNTNQVFGRNLDAPTDFLLAWTPDGYEGRPEDRRGFKTGGTGQAIEMAARKGIPVFNLGRPDGKERFDEFMKQRPQREEAATPTKLEEPKPGTLGSKEKPHSVPMYYKIENLQRIRPELRSKYSASGKIADLIASGDRTGTTRTPPTGVKPGHYVTFPSVEGLYRVTGFEKVDFSTPEGQEKWSKREGWDFSARDTFSNQVRHGAVQMIFERVDTERRETAPAKPAIEVWWGTPAQRQNGELSNLAPRPFTINGRDYKSVEHAYQTLKSGAFDETTYNAYLQPGASAKIRGRPAKTEGDWNLQLMKKLVLASFRQNPDAAQKLLDTGDAPITHVRGGPIWAKEFPRILGEVRSELQNEAAPTKQSAATAAPNDSIRKFSRVGFDRSQLERSISVMENQAAKKFFTAIGFKEGDLPAGEGVDILNKLIAAAGSADARRHLNQSALSFASKLYTKQLTEAQFASLAKLAATTPEWVSDEFAELHAKIRLARQEYKPKVASRHNVELVNAVLAKYVGYAIRDRLPGASNKSLFARLKEWLRKTFGETNPAVELFKSEGQRIAASMLTGDLDFFAGKISPDKRRLDFGTLLDDPAVAFESGVIRLLSAAGYTLTGSAALSPQGDIWRSGGSPLHDVDFVAPTTIRTVGESLALISKTLRLDTGRVHHIQRMDPAGTWLDRFLVTKRPGLKLVNVGPQKGGYPSHYEVVDEKTGKVVEWYENRTGNAGGERFFDGDNKPKKSGQLSTILDVFESEPDRITYMEPAGKHKVRISDWRTIFEAKLAFNRPKDLSDFARFKPNRSEVMEEDTAPLTDTERQALRDELTKLRGPDVELRLDKLISQLGGSGLHEFAPSTGDRLIEVAVNAKNPLGVLRHEALHDLFATFNKTPEMRSVVADIERASGSLHVMSQLKKLLANHPEALAQLADPEERAAYAFQFWAEGQLTMTDKGNRIFEAIRQFLKDVFGLVSEGQRAEHLFEAFRDGKFKEPGAAQLALQDIRDKRGDLLRNKFQRAAPKVAEAFDKLMTTAPDRLRGLRNPAIARLADMFKSERGDTGFIDKLLQKQGMWQNRLHDLLKDTTATERMQALRELQAMEPRSQLAKDVSKMLSDLHREMYDAGVRAWDDNVTDPNLLDYEVDPEDKGPWKGFVPIRKVENYFPRAWDPDAIARNRGDFIKLLLDESKGHRDGELDIDKAVALTDRLISGFENRPTPEEDKVLGYSPYAPSANARVLKFINKNNATKFAKFQYQDLTDTLMSNIKSSVHRAVYAETFGYDGRKIRKLVADSGITDPKELEGVFNAVQAMEGTLDPGQWSLSTKKAMSAVMAVQNFVLLPLAVVSQMIDPILLAARTGNIRDAGDAYMTAIGRLAGVVTKTKDKVAGEDLAHILGVVAQDDTIQAMMMSYGPSVKTGSWTDKASRFFFKYNGLQGWNNSMRIAATAAGERFFLANKDNIEFLQEFGLEQGDIKDNNGALDVTSERVKQAMFRFVDQAVLRPTPALRPVWMSDPRFMLVAHLKQFTFAMHKVVLGRANRELNNGNIKPWGTLMLAMPTVLAADMAKYALLGNMPTDWTFLDYLQHSVERSGLLGKSDFAVQATDRVEQGAVPGEALLGPAFENLMEILRYVTGDTQTSFDSVVDRTIPGARFITPNAQEGAAP